MKGLCLFLASLLLTPVATAHHSYAMFNLSDTKVVQGSVAKLEWLNPHIFLWVYVEKTGTPGEFDLYAFESGSINNMIRNEWSKYMFSEGEVLRIEYFPLKDGRSGGAFIKAARADGSQVTGDKTAPGTIRALEKNTPLEVIHP